MRSAAKLRDLGPDSGFEIAFAGRSNVGKSSVINTLTQQNNLARTSRTPGRTQLLNVFAVNETLRLIDLPGFGYAKVSKAMQQRWQTLIDTYMRKRGCLAGVILIMDIRHPLMPFDEQLITWATSCQLPIHIVLNKCDKLKRGATIRVMHEVNLYLSANASKLASVQLYSALKKHGVDVLEQQLLSWLTTWLDKKKPR